MSRIDREITVVLKGNTRSLNVSLQKAAGRVAKFAASVNEANSVMMESAARSNAAMTQTIDRVTKATAAHGPHASQLKKTAANYGRTAVQAAQLSNTVKKSSAAMMQNAARGEQSAQAMSSLAGRINKVSRGYVRAEGRITNFGSAIMQSTSRGERAARSYGPLTSQIGQVAGSYQRTARDALGFGDAVMQSATRGERAVRSFGPLTSQMGQVSQTFGTSAVKVARFGSAVTQSMSSANDSVDGFQSGIVDFIGFTMLGERVKRLGEIIIGTFAGSVAAFASFEDSFALVEKTTQATEVQYENLAHQIREVARVTPIAVNELNQVAGVAGQLGVDIDNIAQFTENMAKMGVATNVTAEEAAIFQARIGAIMQLDFGDDMERMSSSVVDLGNNFAAREDEIFRFTERIAAAGQVVGLTTADLTAFSTAFTAVGVRAERGGTAFQRVVFRMMDAVQEGGEHLALLASTAQMTASEFARLFEDEPAQALLAFIEGLDTVGTDANEIMTELFGNNVRTTQSFLALAGAGDLARSAVERGNTAWEQNVALTNEAETRFDTLANRLRTLGNRINDVAIGIGQTLAPIVETVATGFVQALELFNAMPEPLQNIAIAAGIMAGVFLIVAANLSLMYYPMMVMKRTIIPGLIKGYASSSAALNKLTHSHITAAAAANAQAHSMTGLNRAMYMTRAYADRAGMTVGTMANSLRGAAISAGMFLGKFVLIAAAIYGMIELAKQLGSALDGPHNSFMETSEAAEQLALSVEMSLGAMDRLADAEGISDAFLENNKEIIDDLLEMSQEMRNISATQILIELLLRGDDPNEAVQAVQDLEAATGVSFGIDFDIFVSDDVFDSASAAEELGNQMRFLNDEYRAMPFVQKNVRDSMQQTAQAMGELTASGDPEGLVAFSNVLAEMAEASQAAAALRPTNFDVNIPTRRLEPMLQGLREGLNLTVDEIEIFDEAFNDALTMEADPNDAVIAGLKSLIDTFVELGRSSEEIDLLRHALKQLDETVIATGEERNIRNIQDVEEDLDEDLEEIIDRAEQAADAVSSFGQTTSSVLSKEMEIASGAVQDLSEVLSSIDEDTSIEDAFSAAQSDVEAFIDFTRWAESEGIDEWIIGVVQGGGPEAISEARRVGAERLTELADGLVEDFLTSRRMEIDAEEAFAKRMLDSDTIVDVVSRSMQTASDELKTLNTLRGMGIDEVGIAFLEEAFSDIPGGLSTVMAAFESDEGLGALEEMLPDLIRQAKASADLEFDKWPGNFEGKGAAAAASALKELGVIEEDMPSEIEMRIAAITEGEGEVVTLTELIEEYGKSADEEDLKKFNLAVETGDLETAIDLLEEFLTETGPDGETVNLTVDVDANTVKIFERMQEIDDETFEVFVDLVGGDEEDARNAIGLLTEEEWTAVVEAEANTEEAQRNLDGLSLQERIAEIMARAVNVDNVRRTLNSLTTARTAIINIQTRMRSAVGLANGGIVDSFANGGEAHYPQTAPGGTWRVWAEPETNGEAYIPFAKGKRGRAMRVWEQVGRRFGVEGFADGGINEERRSYVLPPGSRFVEEGSLTTGRRSLAPDETSSRYTGGPPGAMHRPFWTNPIEEAESLEEMKRLLEQQERQLTLMERQEQRRELEARIDEAKEEHGRDSDEMRDAQKALNEFEERVSREDARIMIDMIMEEQRAIEAHNRMIAENRKRFHDERRPRELHLYVLNERIKAEERYTDRWMQLVAERDQIIESMRANLESMLREEKRIKDQLVDLERQYNKDVQRLQDQREESINQALKQRNDTLSQFFDPMTRRESQWGNTIGAVTDNIMDQVNTFRDWMNNLQTLRDRGLSEEAIDALGFNDPSSAHDVAMFVDATDKELQELNNVVVKQMQTVNRQTSREQQNMYGELGDNLKEIQKQFQSDLDDLNKRFRDDQKSLRDELAQIGRDSAKSYADAIAEGLESSIPAIREAARRVQEAMRGSEESGVHPSPPDGSTETAPTGYLVENIWGRDYVDRYFVRIGDRWYAAAGPGQQREALRLYGPPHRRFEGKPQSYDRLVDYFGPGVMDEMKPNRPENYRHTTYDVGGKLPTGLTMAYNGTGQAEYVLRPKNFVSDSAGAAPVHVHVDTYVDGEKVSESVTKHQIRNDRKIRVRAGR